jgi:hypothetical protein
MSLTAIVAYPRREPLSRRSAVDTASEQERDRAEADLLLLVFFAHMACRNAEGLIDVADARIHFVNAVRALHCAVADDVAAHDSAKVM